MLNEKKRKKEKTSTKTDIAAYITIACIRLCVSVFIDSLKLVKCFPFRFTFTFSLSTTFRSNNALLSLQQKIPSCKRHVFTP